MKVIDFYADWCGPCKRQDPIMDELKEDYEDEDWVEVVKVDVDSDTETAQEYGVRSIPTIIIEDEDGEVVKQFMGVTEKEKIVEELEK